MIQFIDNQVSFIEEKYLISNKLNGGFGFKTNKFLGIKGTEGSWILFKGQQNVNFLLFKDLNEMVIFILMEGVKYSEISLVDVKKLKINFEIKPD